VDRMSRSPFVPEPGGLVARGIAVLVVAAAAAALVAAAVTRPWWYAWRAWGLLLLGVLAGAAIVWALATPRRAMASPAAQPPEPAEQVLPERAVDPGRSAGGHGMAEALVELLDAVPTESLRYRVSRALSDAGVAQFAADGEVFDPARHHAVEVEWTDDPQRESRVARTLRPGFSDDAGVVRAAEVLVYRSSRSGSDRMSGRRDR
jgi:hypothetical protein